MAENRVFGSERQFVRWLQSHAPQVGSGLRLGIGDDAALVRPSLGYEVILTTDLSVEGVHFTRKLHPAGAVGHRALARALSDIAAMGGKPKFALVSMALSRQRAGQWARDFYQGLFRLARRFGVSVIGGDTTVHAGPIMVDVMAAGEVPRGRAMLRSGARIGDMIFVSGRLGCSALGLRMLRAGATQGLEKSRAAAIRAHLFPEPQCRLGEFLSRNRIATSAMDLSDGLSIDLARLCEASGVGARIHADLLPLPAASTRLGLTAPALERLALHGGEDYRLLFTVSPKRARSLPRKLAGSQAFRVGEITKGRGLLLVRDDGREERLACGGYDHFRRRGKAD
ncbi:MAG: thiamine-phosphate kinase [Terriglobia bacterium]